MEANTEKLLADVLWEELDKLPLATWTTIEQLADTSPRLEKGEDGRYVLVGEDVSVSLEDFGDIEFEVLSHAEEADLFVNFDYERGFSLHEYKPTDEFRFDEIEKLVLRNEPVRSPFCGTVFTYDGESLSMTDGWKSSESYVEVHEALDDAQREDLRAAVALANVRNWGRDYHNYCVLDGWGWDLVIWFKDGKVFASSGSNTWPLSFGELWNGLCAILGRDETWERPI